MSISSDDTQIKGLDKELAQEQRTPCYKAWTEYRDAMAELDIVADLDSFRAGFIYGQSSQTLTAI